MKIIFILLLPALWILGCSDSEDDKTKAPKEVQNLTGKVFNLSTIEYKNSMNRVRPSEVTLRVEAPDWITGNILCNDYRGELSWNDDNTLDLNVNKDSKRCGNLSDPFNFPERMHYEIVGSRIVFTSLSQTWVATFVEANEDDESAQD